MSITDPLPPTPPELKLLREQGRELEIRKESETREEQRRSDVKEQVQAQEEQEADIQDSSQDVDLRDDPEQLREQESDRDLDSEASEADDVLLPIQTHSSASPSEEQLYEMQVLSLSNGKTEDDLDRQLQFVALDMGLSVLPKPFEARDRASTALSDTALSAKSCPDTMPEPDQHPSSTSLSSAASSTSSNEQAPLSSRPTSYGSGDQPLLELQKQKTLLPLAVSSSATLESNDTPPSSVASAESTGISYNKLRKSIRRLSVIKKRFTAPSASRSPSFVMSNSPSPEMMVTPPDTPPRQPAPTPVLRPSLSRNTSNTCSTSSPMHSQKGRMSRPPVIPPRSPHSRRAVGTLLPSLSESRVPTLRSLNLHLDRPLPDLPLDSTTEEDKAEEEADHLPQHFDPQAARERSLRCPDLQRLRINQIDEQGRFLAFRHDRIEELRLQHAHSWRAVRAAHEEQSKEMMARHEESAANTENRHLAAELELEETLFKERQACETRLKYMETYCLGVSPSSPTSPIVPPPPMSPSPSWSYCSKDKGNGSNKCESSGGSSNDGSNNDSLSNGVVTSDPNSPTVDPPSAASEACRTTPESASASFVLPDAPPRVVTDDDRLKLQTEQRARAGMPNLHAARINVLRERQARQLSRQAARHTQELDALDDAAAAEMARVDSGARVAEAGLRKAFAARKARLLWRWRVVEQIERRRLEDEHGELFGELPEVQWGKDEKLFNVGY